MAQIKAAKAIVTNGSPTVTCTDPTVNWGSIVNGNEFAIQGSNIFYQIVEAVAPNVPGVDPWKLTLAENFAETSSGNPGTPYVISQSFTTFFGLPKPDATDAKINTSVARLASRVDVLLKQLSDTINNAIGYSGSFGFLPACNSLSDLAALEAAPLPDNCVRMLINGNGKPEYYQLRPGAEATNLPDGLARPVDFGGNNERYWIQVG